jgi:hypothetical protein
MCWRRWSSRSSYALRLEFVELNLKRERERKIDSSTYIVRAHKGIRWFGHGECVKMLMAFYLGMNSSRKIEDNISEKASLEIYTRPLNRCRRALLD